MTRELDVEILMSVDVTLAQLRRTSRARCTPPSLSSTLVALARFVAHGSRGRLRQFQRCTVVPAL